MVRFVVSGEPWRSVLAEHPPPSPHLRAGASLLPRAPHPQEEAPWAFIH